MARKREFDYEQAIGRATQVFWAKGYANASLRDLLKAMKIGQGSFYSSVKSKKKLYLECLRHYNATVTRRRWEILAAGPSARAGVWNFFNAILDELEDPKVPSVCLMARSMSSEVLGVGEFHRYVIGEMRTLVAAIAERLEAAKQTGELPQAFDSDLAAQVLITYLQGLFRVVRVLRSRAEMEAQIRALLQGLGLSPPPSV